MVLLLGSLSFAALRAAALTEFAAGELALPRSGDPREIVGVVD